MPAQSAAQNFIINGFSEIPSLLDAHAASQLYTSIKKKRRFNQSLFMTEQQWNAGPKTHKNTNPGPDFNMLNQFSKELEFVEKNVKLLTILEEILGRNFTWYSKKLVCRPPKNAIPDWLQKKIAGKPSNTLGAFMHPEYRDISYHLDNDLHQDILEWPRMPKDKKEHRIITLYIYLHDVTPEHAPVALLPESHRFGATPYQHDITYNKAKNQWRYTDTRGHTMQAVLKPLIGHAGYAAMWHPCLIHGGGGAVANDDQMRLSLRYILARSDDPAPCALDEINKTIKGPLYLEEDYNPGARANKDGTWNLKTNDFLKS